MVQPESPSTERDRSRSTIELWRAACEAHDADRAMQVVADGVVLHSPLTDRVRFEGRAEFHAVLDVALAAFEDVRFHTVLGAGRSWALVYGGRIGSQQFEETQLVELDEQARIAKMTLMIRPLPGLTAVMAAIAGPLARRMDQPRLVATALSLLAGPLKGMTRWGDHAAPLVKPHRA
jgi:SnoaL-like domain